MSRCRPNTLLVAGLLAAMAGAAFGQPAPAASRAWAKAHPRRAEVNARLANQNQRIKNQVSDGAIAKDQAARLHREDHQIRLEERGMASQDGGHITQGEQKVLNAQENQVSHQIGK